MALKKTLYQTSLHVVPPIYRLVSALLFSTCRVTEYGLQHVEEAQGHGPLIGTVWHYSIFYTIHRMKGRDWVAMVSGSEDAEYISRLLVSMGFTTVRGSRGKGGLRALHEMASHMAQEGKNAAIIADGSQGPARKVQAGAILLASKTGAPILPSAWAAERYLSFRSWDRTVLPAPFSKLALYFGKPLYVPTTLKSTDLERYRLLLENCLNGLYSQAWGHFGYGDHDTKTP